MKSLNIFDVLLNVKTDCHWALSEKTQGLL